MHHTNTLLSWLLLTHLLFATSCGSRLASNPFQRVVDNANRVAHLFNEMVANVKAHYKLLYLIDQFSQGKLLCKDVFKQAQGAGFSQVQEWINVFKALEFNYQEKSLNIEHLPELKQFFKAEAEKAQKIIQLVSEAYNVDKEAFGKAVFDLSLEIAREASNTVFQAEVYKCGEAIDEARKALEEATLEAKAVSGIVEVAIAVAKEAPKSQREVMDAIAAFKAATSSEEGIEKFLVCYENAVGALQRYHRSEKDGQLILRYFEALAALFIEIANVAEAAGAKKPYPLLP